MKVLELKLGVEIEPIFATFALYDLRAHSKISEDWHVLMSADSVKRMIPAYVVQPEEPSTLSRAAIFDISAPNADIYLVVRLEKVLQHGDFSDVSAPYVQPEDTKLVERSRETARIHCDRLGSRFRMPLAWTAVDLYTVIAASSGVDTSAVQSESLSALSLAPNSRGEKGSKVSVSSQSANRFGSLPRKSKLALSRSVDAGMGSESEAGASARSNASSSQSKAVAKLFQSFQPLTIRVDSFFRQEADKLGEEWLFKLLLELKRPTASPALKKLKTLPGVLSFDVTPFTSGSSSFVKHIVGPELEPLAGNVNAAGAQANTGVAPALSQQQQSQHASVALTKQLLEFPPRPRFEPHTQYRNVLFVRPLALHLSSVKCSSGGGGSLLSLSASQTQLQLLAGGGESGFAKSATFTSFGAVDPPSPTGSERSIPRSLATSFSAAGGGGSSVRLSSLSAYKNLGVRVQLVQVEQSRDAQNRATLKFSVRPLKSVFSPGPSEWVDEASTSIVYRCRCVLCSICGLCFTERASTRYIHV